MQTTEAEHDSSTCVLCNPDYCEPEERESMKNKAVQDYLESLSVDMSTLGTELARLFLKVGLVGRKNYLGELKRVGLQWELSELLQGLHAITETSKALEAGLRQRLKSTALTKDELTALREAEIEARRIKGSTNNDAPFLPGEEIDYCGEIVTVITNDGSSGFVKVDDDTATRFYWRFQGDDCKRTGKRNSVGTDGKPAKPQRLICDGCDRVFPENEMTKVPLGDGTVERLCVQCSQ